MGSFLLRSSIAAALSSWQLAAGHYETAKIAMEIIAPRAGLTTANRYYKAYPGIPLELPVKVLGGARPFKYELTTAPSGATIGETLPSDVETNGPGDYGIITWANPTTSGSPHNFTAKVTDQEGTEVTVSWTLTVTTSGFIFIDSVNGNASSANGGTGTGTLANPFLTMNDWFAGATGGTGSGTKTDSTNSGAFVYYRTGTYNTADCYREDTATNPRVPCTSNRKPKVHLGYPGEVATIDLLGGEWIYYSESAGNLFFGELTFDNLSATAVSGFRQNFGYESNMGDSGFFKLTTTTPVNAGVGGSNASFLFAIRNTVSSYHFVSHCNFGGSNSHDYWLIYDVSKYVVEWNTVSGVNSGSNGHGFYSKDGWRTGTFAHNKAHNASNSQHLFRFDGYGSDQSPQNFDVCWNSVRSTGRALFIGSEAASIGTDNWEYRNTYYTGNPAREIANATGTLNSIRNVIKYTTSVLSNSTMTVNVTENLQATSGLVDGDNLLTGADRTNYLGIRGHEAA